MSKAEDLLEKLYNYYQVGNISELSKKINSSPSTISNWKQRNSINAIKKKCRKLGIYEEIFNNQKFNKNQYDSPLINFLLSELHNSGINEDELQIELLKLVQRLKAKKEKKS